MYKLQNNLVAKNFARNLAIGVTAITMVLGISGAPASANAVLIDWFSVTPGTPDFSTAPCGTVNCSQVLPNEVANGALTGGLPVVGAGNPAGLAEAVGSTLPWWTPSANVTSQGSTIQSLPINQTMFISQGTGGNDNTAFQTALIFATLTVGSGGGSISFGGDDDMFLAINNSIVGQVGGIHAFSAANDDTFTISTPGTYSMEIFYADRHTTDAFASITVSGDITTAVPETSTWAMMILGFCGVGFMAYRRKNGGSAFRLA
jgi:fibro-slime domain-containing protein